MRDKIHFVIYFEGFSIENWASFQMVIKSMQKFGKEVFSVFNETFKNQLAVSICDGDFKTFRILISDSYVKLTEQSLSLPQSHTVRCECLHSDVSSVAFTFETSAALRTSSSAALATVIASCFTRTNIAGRCVPLSLCVCTHCVWMSMTGAILVSSVHLF